MQDLLTKRILNTKHIFIIIKHMRLIVKHVSKVVSLTSMHSRLNLRNILFVST